MSPPDAQEKIEACPWCMSSCVIEWADKPNRSSARVVCDNLSCMAVSPFAQTDAKAIAAWNAVASLKSRLAASERRVEDLEMMLRRCVAPNRGTWERDFKGHKFTVGGLSMWLLDDGTGLPLLTDEARAALKPIAAQAAPEGEWKSG